MNELTLSDINQAGKRVIKEVKDIQLYIDGAFVDAESQEQFDNYNPFANEKINKVASGAEADIDKAVKAARKAFKGEWGSLSQNERLSYIYKIADLIDEHIEEIAPLESYDTGLPISQTKKMVARAAQNFRFYAEMVKSRLVGDAYQVDHDFLNYTIHKPVGVAGLITP
ncbi:MAG: aldehyde dehydrogenase family protein, partial [Halobacillus sp.]|uniref:aldehyde dehydrogenase family protein n=1 Tax=Halobacillus sp. TaxID=56800 RepID=UPI003BAFA87A